MGSGNIAIPYAGMGIVVLLVAAVFSKVQLPEIKHEIEMDATGHQVGLWSHRLFVFGLIALFAYEVSEISINSFFINYVVDQGWMSARDASLALSFGGLSFSWSDVSWEVGLCAVFLPRKCCWDVPSELS